MEYFTNLFTNSVSYVKDYINSFSPKQEKTENRNKVKENFSKINFNMNNNNNNNNKTISILHKENNNLTDGNEKFIVVKNDVIKLNKPEKANNYQETNRTYSGYGLENQSNTNDFTMRHKSFLKNQKDKRDYKNLNKLKRKKPIKNLDPTQDALPNIHKEQLRTSRIVY